MSIKKLVQIYVFGVVIVKKLFQLEENCKIKL